MYLRYLIFLALFLSLCSCSSESDLPVKTVFFTDDVIKAMTWGDLFNEETEISLNFPDSSAGLLSLGTVGINDSGEFFIVDGAAKQINLFNAAGDFLSIVGKWGGQGPGEFEYPISPVFIDNDLWLFDLGSYRLVLFSAPHYTFTNSIPLQRSTARFILTPQRDIITFSFKSDYILEKWDSTGFRLLRKAFNPQKNLRLFSARFNLGGIKEYFDQGFLMVYPEKFEIHYYNYDLELQLIIKSSQSNRFRPQALTYPSELSPFAFTDKHRQWWSQFLHTADIYILSQNIIGVQLIETNENFDQKLYFNIYNLNGTVYAEGIEIPYSGMVRYSHNGFVYIAKGPEVDSEDNLIPPKLIRYRLKSL